MGGWCSSVSNQVNPFAPIEPRQLLRELNKEKPSKLHGEASLEMVIEENSLNDRIKMTLGKQVLDFFWLKGEEQNKVGKFEVGAKEDVVYYHREQDSIGHNDLLQRLLEVLPDGSDFVIVFKAVRRTVNEVLNFKSAKEASLVIVRTGISEMEVKYLKDHFKKCVWNSE